MRTKEEEKRNEKSVKWGHFIPTRRQKREEKRLKEAPMNSTYTQYNYRIECCPEN